MKFATLIAALFALSLTACGQKAAETTAVAPAAEVVAASAPVAASAVEAASAPAAAAAK